jgi:cytochrome P450
MCPYSQTNALRRDERSGLWQVDDPALSLALLTRGDGALAVRPPGQPLPPHLATPPSALGALFGRWLRQRDDAGHAAQKAALQRALAAVPAEAVRAATRRQAALARGDWNHWAGCLSAASVADLLGLELDTPAAQAALREQLMALAQGLTPEATAETVRAADAAVEQLLAALRRADPAAPLQAALAAHAPPALWGDVETFEANRLALLWQSFEAGAALLAHALQRLGETPALRAAGTALHDWIAALPDAGGAVRNTRRFVQQQAGLEIGGARLAPGEGLLLNLAGAGAGFGAGAHRCPGQDLALEIAAAAVAQLRDDPPAPWPQALPPERDLLLPNARIPQFPLHPETQA